MRFGIDPMKLTYDICMPSDRAAGLLGFTDSVTVEVESGSPGGEPGEFAEYLRERLKEWYDGATVKIREG